MRNNIAYGSPADDWFGRLKANEKDTYEHLTVAFEKEWPLIATVKELKVERIRALKEWILKPGELGKKVESPGGVQVWSHVKWANGLASRVRDAEDKSAFLLSEVFDALPEPVRNLIHKEPRTNYDDFATAVCSLDTKDLKDAAAKYMRDEETA
jgi:formylmethanofuran dehydrogenase subunit A